MRGAPATASIVAFRASLLRHPAMVALWAWLGLWAGQARAEIDEPVTRVSDVTETTAAQWQGYGFRLKLAVGYQDWEGLQGAPSGTGININLEPAWRLTAATSLGLDLDYTILTGDMSGLRLSVGLGPTWHPTDGLQIGAVVGYAAALSSYLIPEGDGVFSSGRCDGQGALGKVRIGYMFQMGNVWATGPLLAASLTWLHCKAVSSTSIDDDSTTAPWLDPWWQYDVNAMWAVTWR